MKARRDRFGDIVLPHDPAAGLPRNVLLSLESWIFSVDELIGVARCEGITELLAEWGNLDTTDSAREWAQSNRSKPVTQAVATDPAEGAQRPHGQLLNLLIKRVLLAVPDDRALRTSCLRELIAEWYATMIDAEKLLGHLLRVHGAHSAIVGWSDESLAGHHAQLHLGAGAMARAK
jgi:hypothetical protein